jgi:hypothetical protein
MVPSESAPQELSNEWSSQYVSKICGQCVLPLVTEVAISHQFDTVTVIPTKGRSGIKSFGCKTDR